MANASMKASQEIKIPTEAAMTTSSSQTQQDSDSSTTGADSLEKGKSQRKRRLPMSVVNFWLDSLLLMLLLLLGWVSATLQIVFPQPSLAAGWSLWGLSFDQWRDVQFSILCTFAFGILVHVMLHWNWVCSVIATQIVHARERPDEGMQTIYGVGTLIALLHILGLGIIAALLTVKRPPL
jgi:hypothetical protein